VFPHKVKQAGRLPLSFSPNAHSLVFGTAVINTHRLKTYAGRGLLKTRGSQCETSAAEKWSEGPDQARWRCSERESDWETNVCTVS
jgi:hypothetical protein